jgi:hypothetical protein
MAVRTLDRCGTAPKVLQRNDGRHREDGASELERISWQIFWGRCGRLEETLNPWNSALRYWHLCSRSRHFRGATGLCNDFNSPVKRGLGVCSILITGQCFRPPGLSPYLLKSDADAMRDSLIERFPPIMDEQLPQSAPMIAALDRITFEVRPQRCFASHN